MRWQHVVIFLEDDNMLKFVSPVFGGLATLSVAALIMSTPILVLMLRYPATDGYYFVTHWHLWPLLCTSILVFSVGFFWQYRKAH
jgi:hypothetical protein